MKPVATARAAKGTSVVELVKMLRHVRKQRAFPSLSPEAEKLLAERVLPTAWYPHAAFLELLDFTFRNLLGGSAAKAYEMGVSGGRVMLLSSHKALVNANDPVESVLAMRHAWQTHFNFGSLRAEAGEGSVLLRLSGYEDVPPCHAYTIAGWGAASARLAGAQRAVPKVLQGPWEGGRELVFCVTFDADAPSVANGR